MIINMFMNYLWDHPNRFWCNCIATVDVRIFKLKMYGDCENTCAKEKVEYVKTWNTYMVVSFYILNEYALDNTLGWKRCGMWGIVNDRFNHWNFSKKSLLMNTNK